MILLIGAKGQLGKCFQQLFTELGLAYIATHHQPMKNGIVLDVNHLEAAEPQLRSLPIQYMINCAAYNDVDEAEGAARSRTFAINRDAPAQLARLAKDLGAVFVTYSTDYVFDGQQTQPYTEDDVPDPLNVYGQSKLEGEQAVLAAYDRVFIIRTSWVFGQGRHNFVKSVMEWSASKQQLHIVDDQISVPTYAKDLAEFSWRLISTGKFGLYHLTNSGQASKYDQAQYVLQQLGWQGQLERASLQDFQLPAQRPRYAKLDNTKAERCIGRSMPHWKDALDRYLVEYKQWKG